MKANTRIILIATTILLVAILTYMLAHLQPDNQGVTIPTRRPSPVSTSSSITPTAKLIPSSTAISQPAGPFPTPRPLPTKTPILTPIPTFFATLYPYSLDSTDGWSVYTNTQYAFSFMYPSEPPLFYTGQSGSPYIFMVNARWDSESVAGVANIAITIFNKSEDTSLDEFIRQTEGGTIDDSPKEFLPLIDILKQAGAEEAIAYLNQVGVPAVAALHKGRVYVFTQGYESNSHAQQQIFQLLVKSVQFIP